MIGIFDSGSGGLTVLNAIRRELPSADVVYFGDTKNAPYGSKSREELTRLTVSAIGRLKDAGAESIVSACNSVSASLAVSLYDTLLPRADSLIEMVGPTVAAFRTSSAKLLVLATEATVKSEIYQNGFRMIGKEVKVLALPELAGALERGASQEAIASIVQKYLVPAVVADVDEVVLACTHYPLAFDVFRDVLPTTVRVFDPADAVAERVKRWWWPREVGEGTTRFLVSRDSEPFRNFVRTLFPNERYTVEVVE